MCWSVGFVALIVLFDGSIRFILDIVVNMIFVVYDGDDADDAAGSNTRNYDGIRVATIVFFILFA